MERVVFDQKPVFWRKGTLGECPFDPDKPLAASASWVAQEKRMLEKVNNLRIEQGNGRPLDEHERKVIIDLLRRQDTATWPSIRKALKPYWKSQGLPETPKFNLERGGEEKLTGNRLENSLARTQKRVFHESVDDYLEICATEGRKPEVPLKGSFNVRLGRDLHRRAMAFARRKGLNLNTVVSEALRSYLDREDQVA